VGRYSDLKKNGILTHDTTWMNLENIILSEKVMPRTKRFILKLLFFQNIQDSESIKKMQRGDC
jgi:hypothetical protein